MITILDSSHGQLSLLSVGIILISAIAGIAIISLVVLFIKRFKNKTHSADIETPNEPSKLFQLFKLNPDPALPSSSLAPMTSSLDSHDIFSSLLEYPPTILPPKPTTTISNENDPISLSLARQNMEERAGYYKSPSRKPVPYYSHRSTFTSASVSHHLAAEDEDLKMMQRWSASSYHVW